MNIKKITIATSLTVLIAVLMATNVEAAADLSKVDNFGKQIVDALRNIATIVAIICITLSGFYYMTSNANPERLDKAKKTLLYAAIGLAIVFAASVFAEIVKSVSQSSFGG